MDNFDLKKYLTENRLTKKYQFLNEGVSNKALASYLNTALWSSSGEGEEDLDANYDISDIAKECKEKAKKDLEAFYKKAEKYLEGVDEGDWAHDFWLTRNGHGAGFWDGDYEHGDALTAIAERFKEIDLYVGDDGQIHSSGGEEVEEASCGSKKKGMGEETSDKASFEDWANSDDVIKNEDGTYSTQDAQWKNRLKDKEDLRKYFDKEFGVSEEGMYDNVAKLRKATKKLQELIKLQKEGNKQYPETPEDAEAVADEYEEEQELMQGEEEEDRPAIEEKEGGSGMVSIEMNAIIRMLNRCRDFDDCLNSLSDLLGYNNDLSDDQAEELFSWFQKNFPKAQLEDLGQIVPSLQTHASQYGAEMGRY